MTEEEERQRLQAELLRKQQEQVAMLSQSAMTPEELAQLTEQAGYDPSGKEAMLATMLRGGQDAVFGDMPQGKQIGDIYVAPTWSESLNAAAQKMIGGYQMGQARKEQTAIDEKRRLSKAAAARVAAEQARAKQQATAESELNDLLNAQGDDARAERQLTQAAENARLAREGAESRFQRTLSSQDARAEAARAHALEMERIRQENKAKPATDAGPKIDPISLRRLKQEESVFGRLGDAVISAQELQAKGMEIGKPFVDYMAEKSEKIPLGGETLSNIVTNKGYTPEEMDVRGRLDNAVEQYRRAFTGANLTQIEKLLGKNWDPTASGISTDEKIKRAENLMDVLNANRDVFDLSMLEKPQSGKKKKPEDMTEEELAAELGL